MKHSAFVAALAIALLTACSSSVQTTPVVTPAGTPVTFVVVVPGGGGPSIRKSHARQPRFISPSTQSIVIALSGKILLTTDVSASSSTCKAGAAGSRTCTAQTSAPSGDDVFSITAYDGAKGNGNVLASGNLAAKLVAGQAQQLHISLTGKPASIALSVETPYPPAGKAATFSVTAAVLDADGNTIIGSYGTKIALANGDTSGATQLSPTSISKPSTHVTLAYDGAPLSQATLTASATGLPTAIAVFAPSPTVVAQYTAPQIGPSSRPLPAGLGDLCIGPDGNIWATATSSGGIEKITPDGTYTSYLILGTAPVGISVGSDHDLWFAEQLSGSIGKSTTSGKITSYKIPNSTSQQSQPAWTTLGPDGRTWFVDQGLALAGAITSSGKFTEYPLPPNSFPEEIVAGPDGNLWITDGGLNAIIVLSTSGKVIATHDLPTPNSTPWGIGIGPDKNMWIAEYGSNRVGRMTTAGKLKEFTPPTALAGPLNIAAGPDGNVWFAETGGGIGIAGKIGYVTTDGSSIRDFPIPGTSAHVHNLAFDSKGTLWFTEFTGPYSALGKLIY